MDYEASLNQALDLLADGEDARAKRILQGGIDDVKRRLAAGPPDRDGFYYWGRFLTAMEEYEQALLKFEKALQFDPAHEGSLWETASILLHDLDQVALAKRLLEEKILPLFPENESYREALNEANFLLRLSASPPEPPPETPDQGP